MRGASFRTRLLAALLLVVGVLLGVNLLVIRRETSRQVTIAVADAELRAARSFGQLEGWRNEQLARLGGRLASSNRLPAALLAALEDGDPTVLVDAARYELELADIGPALVVFADGHGEPVLALRDAVPLGGAADDPMPPPGEAAYRRVGELLFGIQSFPLELGGFPVGVLSIGFPVDDGVAARIAEVVDAEICFAVAAECVARSPGIGDGPLLRRMAAAGPGRRRVEVDGRGWMIVGAALGASDRDEGGRILALPLDPIRAPFVRIRRAEHVAGGSALLLALLLSSLLARGLARPIAALVEATARIARGDYAARVPAERDDEIGRLGHAFNGMAEGLTLKERYRGVLDKVVSREIADELVRGEVRLGGESRAVATLFADLRGFTRLSEAMDPQEVIGMLNGYMEAAGTAVERAGGVVDKYVGDQVMAIFGAPLADPDAALHAAQAAAGVRDAIAAVNARRRAAGEPTAEVGIGVAVGTVVAGNMGSPTRLNYTVLGRSVNVAAHLCAAAAPGEILLDAGVAEAAAAGVASQPVGSRILKGSAGSVQVHRLVGLRAPAAVAALLLGLALSTPSPGLAQGNTLVTFVPGDGTFQATLSGRLELDAHLPSADRVGLLEADGPLLAGRASAFVDLFAGTALYGLVELRADRGEAPGARPPRARLQQAFARLAPSEHHDIALQAGRFALPFGSWIQRRGGGADPFLRPPLHHDQRTILSSVRVPGSVEGLLGWRDDPRTFRPIGAPPVWDVPYPLGAMALAGAGPLHLRAALVNAAPSSETDEWGMRRGLGHPTAVAHATLRIRPELRVGASWARGAWLHSRRLDAPPAGGYDAPRYRQELIGFEAEAARGAVSARGELVLDRWEVPNVGSARERGYAAEAQWKPSAGVRAAIRYSALRFGRLAAPGADAAAWDYDVDRWQGVVAYRPSRATEAGVEYLHQLTRSPHEPGARMVSLRLAYEP